jgi:hypothetical protein
MSIKLSGTAGAQTLAWNGENLAHEPVSSGMYTASLETEEPGSSMKVESVKFQVLDGPPGDPLGQALLVPNPALHSDSAELRYDPAFGEAKAVLYTLAGERAAAGGDPGLSGVVALDLSHLSGGIYLCVATQGFQTKVLKLAVLR